MIFKQLSDSVAFLMCFMHSGASPKTLKLVLAKSNILENTKISACKQFCP